MKIVFLSYLHGFGGAEKQIVMLANAMAERKHDVTLISISADNNCYPLNNSVNYLFIPDRKTNFLRILTRYHDIRYKLIELKPDITVSFWFQSAYLTACMSKKITGKVIYSERSDPDDKQYDGILGLVRTLVLPRIDGFVFQSKAAQRYFNKSVQARSEVIPNPVFVRAQDYPPIKERRKAIVNAGRLHPQKNQKFLIDTFAMIADQIPDYTLEIYGDGELKETLLNQIHKLSLEDRILLKGTSDHIHELIYDASLFVLSSDYEGMPNVLLEAMALGLPCISTDYRPGGVDELIDNGINGLIVPMKNKEELAKNIIVILQKSVLSQRFSQFAKQKSKKLQPDSIYSVWEKVFRKLSYKG